MGAIVAAMTFGTTATAAVKLDQSSIPAYPGPGSLQGTGFSEGVVHGQTFTVGLDGRLAKIDLAVVARDADRSGSLGVSLQSLDGRELFATQLQGEIPGSGWWYGSPIDLTAADIRVKAGDQLKIVLTGAGAETGDYGWYYMALGAPFAYDRGVAFAQTPYYHEFAFDYGFRSYVDTSAVPEPGAWALMIAGFAMTGGALRRIRRGQATTAA